MVAPAPCRALRCLSRGPASARQGRAGGTAGPAGSAPASSWAPARMVVGASARRWGGRGPVRHAHLGWFAAAAGRRGPLDTHSTAQVGETWDGRVGGGWGGRALVSGGASAERAEVRRQPRTGPLRAPALLRFRLWPRTTHRPPPTCPTTDRPIRPSGTARRSPTAPTGRRRGPCSRRSASPTTTWPSPSSACRRRWIETMPCNVQPAPAGRARQGGHPGGGRHAHGVQHDRHLGRRVDGHRGHEGQSWSAAR